ncbi:hypothetical protein K474DRAFT_1556321, partial [Panus rudis PR-1116 ss-1]
RQVCIICLTANHKGPMNACSAEFLWNGDRARARRNSQNRIVAPSNREICIDWQRARGCKSHNAGHLHECSGCGGSDHGAQNCALAE